MTAQETLDALVASLKSIHDMDVDDADKAYEQDWSREPSWRIKWYAAHTRSRFIRKILADIGIELPK